MDDGALTAFGAFMGFFLGAILTAAICVNGSINDEAIERGYAQYCPLNGKWAWKGECE